LCYSVKESVDSAVVILERLQYKLAVTVL